MNDVSPSDDELVSSYLDGEATPEEVARVEADPGLLARAEEMGAAIELAATPVQVPELDLARIRARAVAAGDTTPVVRDLRAGAAERDRRHETRSRLLAIAAAVVFLGVTVTVISSIDQDANRDTASVDDATASDSSEADGGDDLGDDASTAGLDTLGDVDEDDADEESRALAAEAAPLADTDAAAATDSGTDGGADDSAGAESTDPATAFLEPGNSFDILPARLDPSADGDALQVQLGKSAAAFLVAGEPQAAPRDDPEDPPCVDNFLGVFAELGLTAADIALASVAGEDFVVAVARDQAGELFVLSTPIADCGAIEVEGLVVLG